MNPHRNIATFVLFAILAMPTAAWAYDEDHGVMPDAPVRNGAPAQNEVRPEIGKPIQVAQQLLNQKKFKEALAQLHQAETVSSKTAYEAYVVSGTKAAIDLASGDDAGALKDFEAVLATGVLPAKDVLPRESVVAQLAFRIKDYAKTIDYAQRYYRDGGTDAEPRLLMAQAYFQQDNFADAEKNARQVIDDDDKAGRKSEENLLLMLAYSADKQKDFPGYINAVQRLVVSYPKPRYWDNLITSVQHSSGFSDRFALDVDLLRIQVGPLAKGDDYMRAAQLALQEGLPGSAQTILAAGTRAGLLGKGDDNGREKRLAEMAARQAGDDKAQLDEAVKSADQSKDGLQWVKLGEALASYGRYTDAISAFEKGIKKGGLKYPEDAKLHLGITQLKAGRALDAREQLKFITGNDGSAALARLWLIEAGQAN
jgi:hypothetical protein